jgi:hypothetical protein
MAEGGAVVVDAATDGVWVGSPHRGSSCLLTKGGLEPHVWERGSTRRATYLPLHTVHHVSNPREGPKSAMAEVSSFPLATSPRGWQAERDRPFSPQIADPNFTFNCCLYSVVM